MWHSCLLIKLDLKWTLYFMFSFPLFLTSFFFFFFFLVYLGHAVQVIHEENKLREKIQRLGEGHMLKAPKYTDDRGHVKIKGNLLGSYLTQLFFKIILEIAFIVGQYYLYGFVMIAKFTCSQSPCPYTVECFMSRPTEKTIFIIFMLVVACVSLLLNVIEVFYLLCTRVRCRTSKTRTHNVTAGKNPGSLASSWMTSEDALKQNIMNKHYESGQSLGGSLNGAKEEKMMEDH
uniref:Gap junction protein n=1 Tax=Cyprinus carpio TaxID=7962 RepID=A0A8C2FLS5_CYPCA